MDMSLEIIPPTDIVICVVMARASDGGGLDTRQVLECLAVAISQLRSLPAVAPSASVLRVLADSRPSSRAAQEQHNVLYREGLIRSMA